MSRVAIYPGLAMTLPDSVGQPWLVGKKFLAKVQEAGSWVDTAAVVQKPGHATCRRDDTCSNLPALLPHRSRVHQAALLPHWTPAWTFDQLGRTGLQNPGMPWPNRNIWLPYG